MTQILSLIHKSWVAQASDRLTSKVNVKGEAVAPHDARFNKTVIFLARDALVVFGFTGNTAIDGIPTDAWISKIVSGPVDSFGVFDEPGRGTLLSLPTGGNRVFYPKGWLTIGEAFDRLAAGLAALPRSTPSIPMISAVGWQWKLKRTTKYVEYIWPRPVGAVIRSDIDLTVERLPRDFQAPDGDASILHLPGRSEDLKRDLRQRVGLGLDKEEAAIGHLRFLSTFPKYGVGKDYLSIHIPQPFTKPSIFVKYLPEQESGPIYTGWIVGPWSISPPKVVTGGNGAIQTLTDWLEIKYIGPSAAPGFFSVKPLGTRAP